MHITKDGRYFSEVNCKAWFDRLCVCGHDYRSHFYTTCHHQNAKGKFCSCKEFKSRVTRRQILEGRTRTVALSRCPILTRTTATETSTHVAKHLASSTIARASGYAMLDPLEDT